MLDYAESKSNGKLQKLTEEIVLRRCTFYTRKEIYCFGIIIYIEKFEIFEINNLKISEYFYYVQKIGK